MSERSVDAIAAGIAALEATRAGMIAQMAAADAGGHRQWAADLRADIAWCDQVIGEARSVLARLCA
jgi:hypothetical protein